MSLWSDSFFRWHQRRISKFPAIICISEIQPRSDEIIAARNVLTKSVSREQSTDWNWKSKVPQVHIPLTVINKRLDCQPATEDSSMMIVKNSFRNVRLAKITFCAISWIFHAARRLTSNQYSRHSTVRMWMKETWFVGVLSQRISSRSSAKSCVWWLESS